MAAEQPERVVGLDGDLLVTGHREGNILVLDRVVRLPDIDALLALINDGSYDDHIEAILAAGHARKRERRGVRRPYGVPR